MFRTIQFEVFSAEAGQRGYQMPIPPELGADFDISMRVTGTQDRGGQPMKLAEALILRADTKKRIDQLRQRLIRNAKVQEGEKPAENPETLVEELERMTQELNVLIQRINKTNSVTALEKDMSLSDAIATRDILVLKHGIYRDLAQAATVTHDIRTKSEVKYKGTVNVSGIQERADQLAIAHRELDTRIQELNWRTDLQE